MPLRRSSRHGTAKPGLKWKERYRPSALDQSGTRPFRELDLEEIFSDPRERTVVVRGVEKTRPWVSPRSAELYQKDGRWYFNVVVEAPEDAVYEPKTFLGVHVGYYQVLWTLLDKEGEILMEGSHDLSQMREIITEAAVQRSHARARGRADLFHRYRGQLKLMRYEMINKVIALVVEQQAAIGIEDVSGVKKNTGSRAANLFRSHWDFGRDETVMTYRAIMVGAPTVIRERKRALFKTNPRGACSNCHASNKGKAEAGKPISYINGAERKVSCQDCGTVMDADVSEARVIAQRCREFWLKKLSS